MGTLGSLAFAALKALGIVDMIMSFFHDQTVKSVQKTVDVEAAERIALRQAQRAKEIADAVQHPDDDAKRAFAERVRNKYTLSDSSH